MAIGRWVLQRHPTRETGIVMSKGGGEYPMKPNLEREQAAYAFSSGDCIQYYNE